MSQLLETPGTDIPEPENDQITIIDLLNADDHQSVSLVAAVYMVAAPRTYFFDGAEKQRQSVKLVDDTLRIVNLALWDEHVGTLDGAEGKCVALRNVQVRTYNNTRNLSTTASTVIKSEKNNRDPSLIALKRWWDRDGRMQQYEELRAPQPQAPLE